MSRWHQDPPDDDRYADTPVDVADVPDFDQPDPIIDPAEVAAHNLIDALTTLEQEVAKATELGRAHTLKQLIKRAYHHVNLVDLKASAKIDDVMERRR